ncbi:fibronectin type III domain-containing protein [Catellatospora sp. NPDC049609]|uniref:fibronectin type III domain-containing protein n=1 Tax=Catellatospora sp. NPDC049609 TaxID=3155505 RepID=UPI00343CD3E7
MIKRWLTVMLLAAPLVVILPAQQAAAEEEPTPTRRSVQGYQAGEILDGSCALSDSGAKLVADRNMQLRSTWLRIDLRGAADQSGCKRGTYATMLNDTAHPHHLAAHLQIIGVLTNDFHSGSAVDFANAARDIACDPAFGRVSVWEIGNEPDLNGVPAEIYAEQLARASRAIHDQCGPKTVINGGLTPGDPFGYLNGVDAAMRAHPEWGYDSLKNAIQGLGLHPYIDAVQYAQTGTRHDTIEGFIRAFTSNAANGYTDMDIYLTEFGFRLPPGDEAPNDRDEVTAEGQCVNLVRAFNTIINERVVAATWFTLKDFWDSGKRYGLFDGDTPRLARHGYVHGNCNGVEAASYNTDEDWLQWDDGAAAPLAPTSYEVMLAPAGAPYYTYFKTTVGTKLLMTAFDPPLPVGDYVYRVSKIVDGKRYPSKDEWSFTYSGKPSPPGGLSAVATANGTSITLSWTDLSHNETGFTLTDGTNYRTAAANTTSYVWTGLSPGVGYCFRMNAVNGNGASRWNTMAVCATTPTAPAAPSGVTATVVTGTSVRVDWVDNAGNETGYEVSDGTTTQTAGANATSHTWTGIANGATRCFKVRAVNAAGWSAYAGNACATTPTVPAAPTGPTAAVATGTSVKVTWTDRSSNEWGFEISNGSTSQVVGANTTTYTWPGIPNGTSMCFKVRAYNLAGYSAYTTSVCATTPTVPVAPASPVATPVSGTSIKVAWADRSSNEIGFEISNGSTSQVVGANSTAFTWGGLANNTYMCFRVRSYNLAGYSAWTAYSCATTPTLPAAPQSPTATPISTSQVTVKWADKSANETGFEVYNGVSTVTVGANVQSYTWGGLAAGTYMCFAVRAKNLAGYSPWTPYACTTTPAPPVAPSGQTATPVSTSQITVKWLDRSGNESGFQIYDGVNTFTVGANVTVFHRTGLPSKTYMCFAVRSYNAYGYSAWTPYACTTTF